MGANPDDESNQKPAEMLVKKPQEEVPSSSENDPAHLHAQTESQWQAIVQDIQDSQDLTSVKYPISALRELYERDSSFDKGVVYLSQHYSDMRRVRGDGNCYYRALLYSLCECVKKDKGEWTKLTNLVKDSLDNVTQHGYERFALELFHEELVELLEKLPTLDATQLHATLNEENATSDYSTWYLRVLTAAQLKSDVTKYEAFLELPYTDIATFCQKEVEPMGRDVSMVQVSALAEALGVQVVVEYLDGRDLLEGKLAQHVFGPSDSTTTVHVLYRPGHYDVLYQNE